MLFVVFLFLKATDLSFRFGDPTAYWLMAELVRSGSIPYKDFFFADPPVLVGVLVPFIAVFREQLWVLQALPSVFEAATAVLLAILLKHQGRSLWWFAPLIYLSTFTILANSDFGTGMQLASLFLMAALLGRHHKRFVLCGILLALAALTKLYMGAAVLAVLGVTVYDRHWRELRSIVLGGAAVSFVLGAGMYLSSGFAFIEDTFLHQLSRPPGISKVGVLSFFLMREWLLLMCGAVAIWWSRVRSLWLWILVGELAFVLIFQDIYYAYLGILIAPMVAIGLAGAEQWRARAAEHTGFSPHVTEMLLVFFCLSSLLSLGLYLSTIRPEAVFEQVDEVVQVINEQDSSLALYGSHEVVPLLALKTDRPVRGSMIDTNTQTFASGAQDKTKASE